MHRFVDHTGEVRLELRAASLPELFAEAGRALAGLLVGDLPRGEAVGPETLALSSRDLGRLLADWLDELVFRSEQGALVLDRFEPLVVSERGELRALAWGHRLDQVRTAVKAATLHQLRVAREDGGWCAEVVLDV